VIYRVTDYGVHICLCFGTHAYTLISQDSELLVGITDVNTRPRQVDFVIADRDTRPLLSATPIHPDNLQSVHANTRPQ
jgi:hypothetical protein